MAGSRRELAVQVVRAWHPRISGVYIVQQEGRSNEEHAVWEQVGACQLRVVDSGDKDRGS